jgi:hypothetical protein
MSGGTDKGFPWPKVVVVEVQGDPEFITGGLGVFPGHSSSTGTWEVHWHESHERISVIDFLLEDSPERFSWKARDSGEFTIRPLTVADWKKTFEPKGWAKLDSVAEMEELVLRVL